MYNALGGAVWATAAVCVGYFLWASISKVEHWAGRASLVLIAAAILAYALYWVYLAAMRPDRRRPEGGRRG